MTMVSFILFSSYVTLRKSLERISIYLWLESTYVMQNLEIKYIPTRKMSHFFSLSTTFKGIFFTSSRASTVSQKNAKFKEKPKGTISTLSKRIIFLFYSPKEIILLPYWKIQTSTDPAYISYLKSYFYCLQFAPQHSELLWFLCCVRKMNLHVLLPRCCLSSPFRRKTPPYCLVCQGSYYLSPKSGHLRRKGELTKQEVCKTDRALWSHYLRAVQGVTPLYGSSQQRNAGFLFVFYFLLSSLSVPHHRTNYWWRWKGLSLP